MRMVLHAALSSEDVVAVVATDTDVLILMIYAYSKSSNINEVIKTFLNSLLFSFFTKKKTTQKSTNKQISEQK